MINTQFSATLSIGGESFLINSMSITYSINSMFPNTTISLGNDGYVWVAGQIAEYEHYPVVEITVQTDNISYSYQGIITGISGAESKTGLTNSITVAPASFYATLRVGTFDGTETPAYLEDAQLLANDVIRHFNDNVFTGIPGLLRPIALAPVMVPTDYNRLLVAPRFLGMPLTDILEQIFGPYGYSVMFTWDDQIIIGSLNNPVDSPMVITKDMIGENSFRDDVSLNIANINLGW